MTKKRYQQIPMQFISKHSHQYLYKKNIINTKYQWLTKFIHPQNEQENQDAWLSKAIKIQPKETIPAAEKYHSKKLLKEKTNAFTILEGNWLDGSKHNEKSYLFSNKQTLKLSKNERNRIKTQQTNINDYDSMIPIDKSIEFKGQNKCKMNSQKIFGSRNKSRNKTIMTQYANFKTKKCFIDKQNIKEKDRKGKLKTQSNIQRCLTKSTIRQKLQSQPFSLTPWMLKEDNKVQQDQFTFL